LFITEQPISLKMFETLFDPPVAREELQSILGSLATDYEARSSALEVREIAGAGSFLPARVRPWIRNSLRTALPTD